MYHLGIVAMFPFFLSILNRLQISFIILTAHEKLKTNTFCNELKLDHLFGTVARDRCKIHMSHLQVVVRSFCFLGPR